MASASPAAAGRNWRTTSSRWSARYTCACGTSAASSALPGGSTSLRAGAGRVQRQAHCQRAAHRPQFARQRQLAGELIAGQPAGIDLSAGGQDAQRDGQVEAARVLGQVGRREVDRDALVVRELQPAVLQRRAHPLARFLHFHVGQPDQREAGQAVGQMHLDRDGRSLQARPGRGFAPKTSSLTNSSPFRCMSARWCARIGPDRTTRGATRACPVRA